MRVRQSETLFSFYLVPIATFLFIMLPYSKIAGLEPLYWLTIFLFIFYFSFSKKIYLKEIWFYLIPIIIQIICLFSKYIVYDKINADTTKDILKNIHTFVLVILAYSYFRNKPLNYLKIQLYNQYRSIFIILIVLSIIGIAQYLKAPFIRNIIEGLYEIKRTHKIGYEFTNFELAETLSRINGIFGSPLAFAAMLSPLIVLTYSMRGFLNINLWKLFFFILSVLTLYLTFSRASFLTCVLGIIIISVREKSVQRIFQLSFLGLIIYIIYSQFLHNESTSNTSRLPELFTYIKSGFNSDFLPSTLSSRIDYMSTIYFSLAKSSSMLVGINMSDYYEDLQGYSFESQYFAWFMKYGLFGLLFFFWYVALAFRMKKRLSMFPHNGFLFTVTLGITTVLFTNFIVGITQQSVHGRHIREILYLSIAIVEAGLYQYTKIKQNGNRRVK